MRLIAISACLVLFAAPLSAAAQTASTAPGAPAVDAGVTQGVTPAKLALVRRYLAAIHYERLMDQIMGAMLPVMVESYAHQHTAVTAQQRQEIAAAVRDVMRDKLTPLIVERMAPIYAAIFSEAELQSIVDFYESPAGRAVIAKTPALAPQAALVMRDLMPEMQAEISKSICERLHCDAAQPPKPGAS